MPAFFLLEGAALIDGDPISVKNENTKVQYQTISPEQVIRYRGLTIEGDTFQMIMNRQLTPAIRQTIKVRYGDSPKAIGEHITSQEVRLDISKLIKFRNQTKELSGIWILEKSDHK